MANRAARYWPASEWAGHPAGQAGPPLMRELSNDEAWTALASIPALSPTLARRLAHALGAPQAVLAASTSVLRDLGVEPETSRAICSRWQHGLDAALVWRDGGSEHCLVGIDGSHYPPRLRELADAPLALYVVGQPQALRRNQLAMVGSRSPSAAGAETAANFARDLIACGLSITSGLARGIDGAAHRGALRARGCTIAVLGHGADIIYPREHRQLASDIVAAGGALVSEFVPGSPPERWHFPRRNRVISGLALGVLVVEAALNSGSLITARQALEQGREVFAIPGSIHNPMARGCHRLIRDGAKLVETVGDILEELAVIAGDDAHPGDHPGPSLRESTQLDDDYVTLLKAMGYEPSSVDQLVQRTGLTPQALSSMLFRLELQGHIRPVPGVGYERVGTRG